MTEKIIGLTELEQVIERWNQYSMPTPVKTVTKRLVELVGSQRTKSKSPNYQGWRAPLPYSRRERVTQSAVYIKDRFQSSSVAYVKSEGPAYCQYGVGNAPIPQIPAVLDISLNGALSDLKDQNVNLAVTFGERAKTINLLTSRIYPLIKDIRAVKKGDIRRLEKRYPRKRPLTPKQIAAKRKKIAKSIKKGTFAPFDLWLEYKYGWLQIYKDMHGISAELARRDKEDPTRYLITAKELYTDYDYSDFNRNVVGSITYACQFTRKSQHSCFTRLDYYPDISVWKDLDQLGLINPAEVIWELTPFSFVADWFLPIGQYFSATSAAAGLKFKSGSSSYRVITETRLKQYAPLYFNEGKYTTTTLYQYAPDKHFQLDRTVYTINPLPALPSFRWPEMDADRLMTAISLLAQAIKG